MAKKIKRNPYRYKENPITLMSPFRSKEFDDAMKEFQKLKTDQIKVGDAVRIGSAKAKDQDFTNFYKDIQNPYQNMERFTEELTVDQRAAEFAKQQAMQSEANIMEQMKGSAGGSGVAGLAQAMASQGQQRAQQAAISIGQQERQNQQMQVQEQQQMQQQERAGQLQAEQMRAQGATQAQQMKAQSSMQQAQMDQQARISNQQASIQNQQMQYQAASDARNLEFQHQQGMLQLIAGKDQADAANEQANKNWGQRTFGW